MKTKEELSALKEEAEELHFPSTDNGLEDTGDVNRRLGI